ASDLDLAIISETHFEAAWRDLRRATQPTLEQVPAPLQDAMSWQKKRFFDGAIIANMVLPYLSYGSAWQTKVVRISERVAVMLHREIDTHFWIYRDYWSLRNYVADGVVKVRRKMVV